MGLHFQIITMVYK